MCNKILLKEKVFTKLHPLTNPLLYIALFVFIEQPPGSCDVRGRAYGVSRSRNT